MFGRLRRFLRRELARITPRGFICMVAGVFLVLACLGLAKRGDYIQEVRLPVSGIVCSPGEADLPKPIENKGKNGRIWAMRAPATGQSLSPSWADAAQLVLDAPLIAAAGDGLAEGPSLALLPPLAPILNQDGATAPRLFASLPVGYGEMLDNHGRPLRWQLPGNVLTAYSLPRRNPFPPPSVDRGAGTENAEKTNRQFARELARLAPARGAANYRALVENFAKTYNLSTELVMAIIHSESNFSARVVSSKSAMGLMQLMPSTASDEVHRFLYGRRGNVSFAQLAVPEINIRYGTAYLHILNNRYFSQVRDSQVREACVIASYNLGPNRFLRLYGSNNQQAVQNINSMSPEEFHADLPRRLPVRETRFYVEKVRRMKQHYAGSQNNSVAN